MFPFVLFFNVDILFVLLFMFLCFCYLVNDGWIMIAERLGLTAEEIRFLDKRTLNPAHAALSFVSKRRIISVGLFYDLLNESMLPVLADLL